MLSHNAIYHLEKLQKNKYENWGGKQAYKAIFSTYRKNKTLPLFSIYIFIKYQMLFVFQMIRTYHSLRIRLLV